MVNLEDKLQSFDFLHFFKSPRYIEYLNEGFKTPYDYYNKVDSNIYNIIIPIKLYKDQILLVLFAGDGPFHDNVVYTEILEYFIVEPKIAKAVMLKNIKQFGHVTRRKNGELNFKFHNKDLEKIHNAFIGNYCCQILDYFLPDDELFINCMYFDSSDNRIVMADKISVYFSSMSDLLKDFANFGEDKPYVDLINYLFKTNLEELQNISFFEINAGTAFYSKKRSYELSIYSKKEFLEVFYCKMGIMTLKKYDTSIPSDFYLRPFSPIPFTQSFYGPIRYFENSVIFINLKNVFLGQGSSINIRDIDFSFHMVSYEIFYSLERTCYGSLNRNPLGISGNEKKFFKCIIEYLNKLCEPFDISYLKKNSFEDVSYNSVDLEYHSPFDKEPHLHRRSIVIREIYNPSDGQFKSYSFKNIDKSIVTLSKKIEPCPKSLRDLEGVLFTNLW